MRSERQLWICGDIHGELSGLVRNAVNRGISCADILVVGDFERLHFRSLGEMAEIRNGVSNADASADKG